MRNVPRRLAMRDFRDGLYGFIIRNSPPYTAVRLGELPLSGMEKDEDEGRIVVSCGDYRRKEEVFK